MKRLISLFLISVAAFPVCAYETTNVDYGQTSGTASMVLTWEFETDIYNEQTCAVITGVKNVSGTATTDTIAGDISVPQSVTVTDNLGNSVGYIVKRIAANAFKNQIGITSITIPSTVEEISAPFCPGCTLLSSITVSSDNPWFISTDGVLYDKSFSTLIACPALATSISIPATTTNIDTEAFANCHRLSTITIPEEVVTIGSRAFKDCTHLKSVTFNGNAPSADSTIFDGTADPTVYVQSGTTGWDVDPWTSFAIRQADGDQASDPVPTTSGNINWWYRVVDNNEAEIYYNGKDPAISSGTRQTYTLVTSESGSYWSPDGTVNIPAELDGHPVTRIGDRAFAGCTAMLGVTIPSSVKKIGNSAFEGCATIEEISLPNAIEELGYAPFSGTWISTLNLPAKLKAIDGNPFAGCDYIDTVTVDGKNRRFIIENNMLFDHGKTKLYGVLPYYSGAFVDEVTIPETVLSLSSNVFSRCEFLKKVTYNCNAPVLDDIELYADTDVNLTNYTAEGTIGWDGSTTTNMPALGLWPVDAKNQRRIVSLYQPGTNGTSKGDVSSYYTDSAGNRWHYRVIDDGSAAEIFNDGSCAVDNTSAAITSITLPTTIDKYIVKSIGAGALSNLRGISSITIPNTYESIGDYAFSNCTALTSVTLGNVVRSIGKHPFTGSAIETIAIPDTVNSIDGNILAGCNPSTGLSISDNNPYFTVTDQGALYDKDYTTLYAVPITVEELEIPATVTDFAEECFLGCLRIKKVSFLGNAPTAADGDDLYLDVHSSMTNFVSAGNTTFGALPGTWHLRPVVCRDTSASETPTETIDDVVWQYYISGGKATVTNITTESSNDTITIPQTLGGAEIRCITTEALNGLSGVKAFASESETYKAVNGVLYSANGKTLVRMPDLMKLPYEIITETVTTEQAETTKADGQTVSIETTTAANSSTGTVSTAVAGDITVDTLLAGVTNIAERAFNGCNVFTDTVVATTNQTDSKTWVENGIAYAKISEQIIQTSKTYLTQIKVPGTVAISENAFDNSGVTLLTESESESSDDGSGDDDSQDSSNATLIGDDDTAAFDASVANTYDGVILDTDGSPMGTITIKTTKASSRTPTSSKITVTICMAGTTKKITLRQNLDVSAASGTWTTTDGRELQLDFTRDTVEGDFDGAMIEGVRNVLSTTARTAEAKSERKSAEAIVSNLKKNYALAFEAANEWNALSVSVQNKGKVRITGKLADGTSVSTTSQMIIGSDVSCIPVVYTKKSVSLNFSIYISNDGKDISVTGLDNPQIAAVGDIATGLGFRIDEGIYELWPDYTLLDEFLPEGLSVAPTGSSRWIVADGAKAGSVRLVKGVPTDTKNSDNSAELKLTFKVSTGIFSGSFKVYALSDKGKLKTFTASVYGVVVDGIGYGFATISKRGAFAIAVQ